MFAERATFRRRHRLSGSRAFRRVFDGKIRKPAGPLVVYLRPNHLPEPRLGLSVGRRIGSAVARNRVKRLLREAFRLTKRELPASGESPAGPTSYDVVITVRPHQTLPLDAYIRMLRDAVRKGDKEWRKRGPDTENAS